MNYKFTKAERITRKKVIDNLFKQGKRYYGAQLLLYYDIEEGEGLSQVLFSVPKRKVRRAVDRNRIKRRLREAYRHTKHVLDSVQNKQFFLTYVYVGKVQNPPYAQLLDELSASIQVILRYVEKKQSLLIQ